MRYSLMTGMDFRAARSSAAALLALWLPACGFGESERERNDEASIGTTQSALSAAEQACYSDPRVTTGLVPWAVCAGSALFFQETFGGNGRTCGSCHPVANNFTIDKPFLDTLSDSDPLFVAENHDDAFALDELEGPDLRERTLIRENLDGLEDPENKFVLRSVQHIFSLSTTIERDPNDATSASFIERTGWSGDGADDGLLANFADGAIRQHFTKSLARGAGDFRLTTPTERANLLAYQLSVGRSSELDLGTVTFNDPFADPGVGVFTDPLRGRCNECHQNAGGKSASGKNTNFPNGIEIFSDDTLNRPTFAGVLLRDGGFGGQELSAPNVAVLDSSPELNGFGDESFNTPSLIEVADTGPFFHHNSSGDQNNPAAGLPGAIAFYTDVAFTNSEAGRTLRDQLGGTDISLVGNDFVNLQSFLRAINVAFNFALAQQRIEAALLLNQQFWNHRQDIQLGLLKLARVELEDAVAVCTTNDGPPLFPQVQNDLNALVGLLTNAELMTDPGARLSATSDASADIDSLYSAIGSNIDFAMGPGNLMF
jgi:cytochrome c peroxidase